MTAFLPAESLIAGEDEDEQAAFEHVRARMLEAETRPEVAAAVFALRWEDVLGQLIARLHATPPPPPEDDEPS